MHPYMHAHMHTYIHTPPGCKTAVKAFEKIGAVRAAPQCSLPSLLGPERLGPKPGDGGEGRDVSVGREGHYCHLNTDVLNKT